MKVIAEVFDQRHPEMVGQILTMEDRKLLTRVLAPLPEYQCESTVLMMLPAQTEKGYETLVFDIANCRHIGQSPLPILDRLTKEWTHLPDFKAMRKFWANAFGMQSCPRGPFACQDFSLIPLGPSNEPLTIWVNPVVLELFIKKVGGNGVLSKFDFAVPVPYTTVTPVLERIEMGATAQGLMMLMEHNGKLSKDDLLFDFLGYGDNELLKSAVGSKKVHQLPLTKVEMKGLMKVFVHQHFTATKVKTEVVTEDLRQLAKKRQAEVKELEKKEKEAKNQEAKQDARERKAKQQKKAKQKAKKQATKKQAQK